MKLKILSGLFSLVAQYFDVSADVEAGAGVGVVDAETVAGVGVADVEAVDGVNARNIKSRWMHLSEMYLPMYPSSHPCIHPSICICLSICFFVCLFIYTLFQVQSGQSAIGFPFCTSQQCCVYYIHLSGKR